MNSPRKWSGMHWIRDAKRAEIYARDDHRCQLCGVSILDARRGFVTLDHIIPVSRGGTNEAANLQTACRPCNAAKGNRAGFVRYASRFDARPGAQGGALA